MPGEIEAAQKLSSAIQAFAAKLPAQSKLKRVLLTNNPFDFWSTLFGSNPFTSNQMVLGEKYMLYVLGIDIHDRQQVPDEQIKAAQNFYQTLFGIYIDSSDDIDKLRQSPEAYMNYHADLRNIKWTEPLVREASAVLSALPANDMPGAWQQGLLNFANKLASEGRGLETASMGGFISADFLKTYAPIVAILLVLGVFISIKLKLYKP